LIKGEKPSGLKGGLAEESGKDQIERTMEFGKRERDVGRDRKEKKKPISGREKSGGKIGSKGGFEGKGKFFFFQKENSKISVREKKTTTPKGEKNQGVYPTLAGP